MGFEWDEAKRLSNLSQHRLDFADMDRLFDGRLVVTADTAFAAEQRFRTTGLVGSRLLTVIWTQRADRIRFISARSARDGEKREDRELFGG